MWFRSADAPGAARGARGMMIVNPAKDLTSIRLNPDFSSA